LVAVVEVAAEALFWIRWLGVAYLVGLGVRTWRRAATDLDEIGAVPPVFQHGLLLAAINPKTLLFNAAFIPQFAGSGSLFEFVTVSAVFLSVVFIGDLAWAIFANGAHGLLSRYTQWRNRVTGGVLIAAGVGLALSRR
jgi:threonine/homoserine/homoserine lactone efflux protein